MRLVNPRQFTVRNFGAAALVVVAVVAAWTGWLHLRSSSSRDRVDFSRDIRPIFNQNCMPCHGGVRQKNGVSFITVKKRWATGKSGRPTIVPGDPDASELMARVTSTDPEARMPYHAPPLPPEQIALLRRWIKQGAQWEDHWAFVPPKPSLCPPSSAADWVRQPLDRFILARLEKEVTQAFSGSRESGTAAPGRRSI